MTEQDKIIKIRYVVEVTGLSTSTIRRLVKLGKFPAPVAIPGTTRKGWSQHAINEYVNKITNKSQSQVLAHNKTWRTTKL